MLREGRLELLTRYRVLNTNKVEPQLENSLAANRFMDLVLLLDKLIVEQLVTVEFTKLNKFQLVWNGLTLGSSFLN